MSEVRNTFTQEVEDRHTEMLNDLESISIEDLKSDGVSLSFGGKTFKFSDLEIIQDETLEEKLRKEFKEKLNSQQQRIRDKINSKINQLLLMHQNKQQELDRKEKAMRKKYTDAAMMPEITEAHMLKGLSVVKGSTNDELTWVYRAIYNPRFIVIYNNGLGTAYDGSRKQRKAIPSRLVTRMKKPILLIIKTKGNKITGVATKETIATGDMLPAFPHYHQTGNGDCWGSWSHDKSWKNPNDILKTAKDAEAVLETINQGSIASRGPSGLPRIQTLLDAVEKLSAIKAQTNEDANLSEDDVWQAG